jgi:hypothetical protein
MDKKTTLKDLCSFTGFRALARLRPNPEHPGAVIVTLNRRQKKRFAPVARFTANGTTHGTNLSVTWMPLALRYTWNSKFAGLTAQGAKP